MTKKYPKINSNVRCHVCFKTKRWNTKSFYSVNTCMKCYYQHMFMATLRLHYLIKVWKTS
jgi:hypothetical protein